MSRHRHADNRSTGAPTRECRHVRANLLAFVDGDLDGMTRQAVQAHIDACAACRREWEWQRQAEHALQTAQHQVPPAGDLRAGFYARLAAQEPEYRPSLRFTLRRSMPHLALGALAMTLLIAVFPTAVPHDHPPVSGPGVGPRFTSPVPVLRNAKPDGGAIAHNEMERNGGSKRDMTVDRTLAYAIPHPMRHSNPRRAAMPAPFGRSPLVARVPEIANSRALALRLPLITLPLARPANMMAMYLATRDSSQESSGLSIDRAIQSGSDLATSTRSSGAIRAELMNEEVNVHIVNDRNEEVGSLHVAPANADTSVVHIEASEDTDLGKSQAAKAGVQN